MHHQFNIQQFYVLPTQCIYVFCVDLRTNSDYFTVQYWLVGFYNWDGVCLLRGTFYILRSAHTVYLCVLCGSENKQRLFHCTALTDWLVFITETECFYCVVRSTFYVLPTQCIYVFCVDLRTNSDYFTVQHWLTDWFLGAVEKFEKRPLASSCLSVRPCLSAYNNSCPTGRIFMKFYMRLFFKNLSRKYKCC